MKLTGRRAAAGSNAIAVALAVIGLCLAGLPASAQDYPSRPVRIIVPFSPGGAVDGPARLVAQKLSERLGQQVFVENKPGAGATIGADLVAKSPPDGYTLLLPSQTNAISASLYRKLPYDAIEDFTPIMLIGQEPGVLVVHPSLPVGSLKDFFAYVKERPGKVDYASSGNGSGQHLFMAMLASMAGLQMNHIPYKGSGQATADVLAGQVPTSFPGMAGMLGHIRAGKLRALAVSGSRRSPQLPDVPAVAEMLPGFEAYVWMGLMAPKGTPQPVVDRLHRELVQVMATAEVKAYYTGHSLEIVASSPAEFGKFFREEKDRWGRIIQQVGAKVD